MQSKKEVGLNFIKKFYTDFICPCCKEKMYFAGESLKCTNKHTFDVTKKGTINFIISPKIKESKIYNEKLFTCRRKFIENGYYNDIYKLIANEINNLNLDNIKILDLGCGEGIHSINILNKIKNCYRYFGFDYSKDAINLASDYNSSKRFYFNGDVNNIPIASDSIDVIIDFLSPYSESEVKRVLKKGGIFIKIAPSSNYLLELREACGLGKYQKQQEIIDNLGKYFKDIVTENYQKTFKIEKDDIANLIGMTPLKLKSYNLKIEQITIDLNVYKMVKWWFQNIADFKKWKTYIC